jgi:hypothetical protein
MHGLSAEGSRYGTTKTMFVPGLRSLRAWRSTKRSAGSPPCGEYDQARVLHGRWGVHPNTVLCRGRRPPRRPWAGPRTGGTGLPLPRTAHAWRLWRRRSGSKATVSGRDLFSGHLWRSARGLTDWLHSPHMRHMPVAAPRPPLVAASGLVPWDRVFAQITAQGGFDVIAAQLKLLDAAFRGSRHRVNFSLGEPVVS